MNGIENADFHQTRHANILVEYRIGEYVIRVVVRLAGRIDECYAVWDNIWPEGVGRFESLDFGTNRRGALAYSGRRMRQAYDRVYRD